MKISLEMGLKWQGWTLPWKKERRPVGVGVFVGQLLLRLFRQINVRPTNLRRWVRQWWLRPKAAFFSSHPWGQNNCRLVKQRCIRPQSYTKNQVLPYNLVLVFLDNGWIVRQGGQPMVRSCDHLTFRPPCIESTPYFTSLGRSQRTKVMSRPLLKTQ